MKKENWFLTGIIIVSFVFIGIGALFVYKSFLENLDVMISSVKPYQEVKSPLLVEGKARGTWFFEASFPIKIIDENNRVLGISYVQTQSDWMTKDFVDFKGEISFSVPAPTKGFLILSKDNPTGLPQYDKEVRIPIILKPSEALPETIKIKVYFNNNKMDPEFSCNKVFAVEREIPKTLGVAKAAIEELLKGPTDLEKEQGYLTSIPSDSKLNNISIINGVAQVDFNDKTEWGGGSCSMAARVAQITQTLLQFPTITSVKLSINGRTEDIFQP